MVGQPHRFHRILSPGTLLEMVSDAAWIYFSALSAAWSLAMVAGKVAFFPLPELWQLFAAAVALAFPLSLQAFGLYGENMMISLAARAQRKLLAWAILTLGFLVILFLLKMGADVSRLWIVSWFTIAAIGLTIGVVVLRKLELRLHGRLKASRSLLIIGSGPTAQRVFETLSSNPAVGLRPVAYLSELAHPAVIPNLPCWGKVSDVEQVLSDRGEEVDEVWLTLPSESQRKIQMILTTLRTNLVDVRLVPDMFMHDMVARDVDNILGLPVIGIISSPHVGIDKLVKRLMDIVGASIALLFASPVLLVAMFAVRLSSPGGVIFRQERHGLGGRTFMVFKLRTMYTHQSESQYQQARKGDPRVTPVGRILRKYSIDELPQLWNVLIGDMSLVGPRPHPAKMNASYWDKIDRYAQRHQVKPGITGLSQVNGLRGETADVELLRRRIEYDLLYIDSWSLTLDIKILFRTLFVIWSQPEAY